MRIRRTIIGSWLLLTMLLAGCGDAQAGPISAPGPIARSTPTPTPTATATTAAIGPCDILQDAGTPCVAAHSTTRALYAAYRGPLYRVKRADGQTLDIGVVAAGGVSDARRQQSFCAGSACIITLVYDQSPQHNNLAIEGRGSAGRADDGARADALPITINGHLAYGISFDGRMGYRNNGATGLARDGAPESMMMVTSALHTNASCCFDYGNAEITNTDTGNGHMDTIYFGMRCRPGATCLGSGPWLAADLENGLFQSARGGNVMLGYRGDPTSFVTAFLKNDGRTSFTLRSGDAQRGLLATNYRGDLPPRHRPMHQEGAIVLGTGGDNSNGGTGLFFEGWIVNGLTSTTTEDKVQANVVAAGYAGL